MASAGWWPRWSSGSRFTFWTVQGSALPITWDDAIERLMGSSATPGTGRAMSAASTRRAVQLPAARLGAVAVGAAALGAGAIGAVAIGRLAIGRAIIRHLRIEELEVNRLHVHDLQVEESVRSATP